MRCTQIGKMYVVPGLSQCVGNADDLSFRSSDRQATNKKQRCSHGSEINYDAISIALVSRQRRNSSAVAATSGSSSKMSGLQSSGTKCCSARGATTRQRKGSARE